MSKSIDRLSEVREQIRRELQRLDEREGELNRKVEGLKAYIAHLEGRLHEVRQVSSEADLREIVERSKLEIQIRPALFKLSRYFVEKEVEQKLEGARGELKETLREIEATERTKKDVNMCPDCHGQGQLREVNYVRDDGIVRPLLRVTRCSLCGGKGRID